ncbi:MAG: hypothetical protein AAF747_00375 [Planctomycetota bacterium]
MPVSGPHAQGGHAQSRISRIAAAAVATSVGIAAGQSEPPEVLFPHDFADWAIHSSGLFGATTVQQLALSQNGWVAFNNSAWFSRSLFRRSLDGAPEILWNRTVGGDSISDTTNFGGLALKSIAIDNDGGISWLDALLDQRMLGAPVVFGDQSVAPNAQAPFQAEVPRCIKRNDDQIDVTPFRRVGNTHFSAAFFEECDEPLSDTRIGFVVGDFPNFDIISVGVDTFPHWRTGYPRAHMNYRGDIATSYDAYEYPAHYQLGTLEEPLQTVGRTNGVPDVPGSPSGRPILGSGGTLFAPQGVPPTAVSGTADGVVMFRLGEPTQSARISDLLDDGRNLQIRSTSQLGVGRLSPGPFDTAIACRSAIVDIPGEPTAYIELAIGNIGGTGPAQILLESGDILTTGLGDYIFEFPSGLSKQFPASTNAAAQTAIVIPLKATQAVLDAGHPREIDAVGVIQPDGSIIVPGIGEPASQPGFPDRTITGARLVGWDLLNDAGDLVAFGFMTPPTDPGQQVGGALVKFRIAGPDLDRSGSPNYLDMVEFLDRIDQADPICETNGDGVIDGGDIETYSVIIAAAIYAYDL